MKKAILFTVALSIFSLIVNAQSGSRSTESIGLNDISIIEFAGNGDIWAGSSGQGLAFYNAAVDTWAYYNTANTTQLQSNNITAIWANAINGVQHAVIGNTAGATDFVNNTPVALTSLPESNVRGVVYRPDSLWILTDTKLSRYDSLITYESSFNSPFANITCSRRGASQCAGLWAGTANNGCFFTVDGVNFTYIDTSVPNQRLVDNRVNAIAIDNQCIAKFIGTKGGFSMCPTGSPCQNFTTANGLPQNDITSVSNACGKVWLGTRDSGVVMFTPPATFERITTANGLPDNHITAVSSSPLTCQTYIATANGNITLVDTAGNIVKQFTGIGKVNREELALRVFPQPAANSINFVLEKEMGNTTLQLTDIAGRVVATTNISATRQATVDVAHLQPGIYFYQLLQNAQVVKTGKVDIVR